VLEVAEKNAGAKNDRGSLVLRRTAVNQRGETVMESDWSLILRRQTPLAA
jgi:acyl dehydratase